MMRIGSSWRGSLAILVLAGPVAAEQPRSSKPQDSQKESYDGKTLFNAYCASCHGATAHGDGPLADHLRFRPTDLTLLARHNNGKWDGDKVRRTIDGRDPVKGHGGPDMPVWGDAFKSSRDGYDEASVKEKIRALEEYLATLQAPAEGGSKDAPRK